MRNPALRKALAILARDARISYSYTWAFWMSFAGVIGQAVTFYFLSKLIGASSTFSYNGRSVPYYDYVAVNLAFLRFQSAALASFQRAVRGEQLTGTMEAVLVTPTGLSLLIASSGLWAFALTFVEIAIFLSVAVLLGLDLSHVQLVTTATFMLLTVLALSPLGIFAAAGIMTFKQQLPTGLLVGGIASLLGGVLFPISKLPPYLRNVSWFVPLTHSLGGIRGAVAGATIWDMRGDALWLIVMSALLLPVSLLAFARSVKRAKIDGTLGDY
jgi:ABC-2 type transport system permease protein